MKDKIILAVFISMFLSLVGYSSTSYVDNMRIALQNEININKTRVELIYESLHRIERNIESVRKHIENGK